MIEFKPWPKILRIENETYSVTEKIDGTNACIIIDEEGNIAAQSRTKIITPGKTTDNYGFAQWVLENQEDLKLLGPGYHYGEWWGAGIQRRYGLDHKRFSLFAWWTPEEEMPKCCYRVPLIDKAMTLDQLKEFKLAESLAAPGFTKVEGLIIKSNSSNQRYKIIWDK